MYVQFISICIQSKIYTLYTGIFNIPIYNVYIFYFFSKWIFFFIFLHFLTSFWSDLTVTHLLWFWYSSFKIAFVYYPLTPSLGTPWSSISQHVGQLSVATSVDIIIGQLPVYLSANIGWPTVQCRSTCRPIRRATVDRELADLSTDRSANSVGR